MTRQEYLDSKRTYIMMIDTETAGTITAPLVFDLGWAIIDKKGKVYEKGDFVITDIFYNIPLMEEAYYASKIPMYWEKILNKNTITCNIKNARYFILQKMKQYNCNIVCAHNARFDERALDNTWYRGGEMKGTFFPSNVVIWDTMQMARQVVCKTPTYTRFCNRTENFYYQGKVKKNRATAEALYKYISFNDEFKEAHTALSDALIESEILVFCLRKRKKMNKRIKRRFET